MAKAIPYDEKVADVICEETSSSNKSLTAILAENPSFPRLTTIYKWLNQNETFAKNYARAKEDQADFLAEEIIAIADDSRNDTEIRYTPGGEAYEVENKEWVNRSRLRVDARKWVAAKLKPKKYGDKLELDGSIPLTGGVSDEQFNELLKACKEK